MAGITDINNMTGPLSSTERMQQFLEHGVGDETLGSRTLGTLTKGKLFEAPSAGFGQQYAAENIPVLKDMDPISRGVYNAIAPYGEKAFDIIDTIFRLPGAAVADVAQIAGVNEDDVNEIQALINVGVGLKLPEASPVMTSAAASKAVKDISKAVNVVKTEAKWLPEYISGEARLPFLKQPQPKSVGAKTASGLVPIKHKGKITYGTDLRLKKVDPAEYTMKPTDPKVDTASVISRLNPRAKVILEEHGLLKDGKITNLIRGHPLGKSMRPEIKSKKEKFAWFRQYKSLIKNLKQYMIDTASPKFLTTKKANAKHMSLEDTIVQNLVYKSNLHKKRDNMAIKQFQKEDKRYQGVIDEARKKMEELKIESKLYHPLKHKEVTYGVKPDPDLPMEVIRRIAEGRMNQGGLVRISQLTRPI